MKSLRSNSFRIFMIVAAFLLGAVAFPVAVYSVYWLFSPDTECSEGFTEEAWGKLEVGMSESEVRSIIGEPLSEDQMTTDREKRILTYSFSVVLDWYVEYYLVIQDGRVLKKERDVSKYFKD